MNDSTRPNPASGASTTPDNPFPHSGVVLALPMTTCQACDFDYLECDTYPVLGIGRCCNQCLESMREADAG